MSTRPLRVVSGVAAVLDRTNVDTDVIIRVERMTSTDPLVLAPFAFEALRYRPDGTEDPGFACNRGPFRSAEILVSGANFGCGSSREPAVWAIAGLGIRVVVAPSFGDIFRANCQQNGLLAVVLDDAAVRDLMLLAGSGAELTVDLGACEIRAGGQVWPFVIGAAQRRALLEGLDDLDLALREVEVVRAWETADRTARQWAWSPVERASERASPSPVPPRDRVDGPSDPSADQLPGRTP